MKTLTVRDITRSMNIVFHHIPKRVVVKGCYCTSLSTLIAILLSGSYVSLDSEHVETRISFKLVKV